jgi:hypothetical protein
MLLDPENPGENWTEVVTAKTLGEAQMQCELIVEASDSPLELLKVTQLTKTSKTGKYKFVCWFKSEQTE